MSGSAAALAAALFATSAALNGVADAGVLPDLPGGTIDFVTPTGFAWRDGIRTGQVVLEIDRADSVDGWRLKTRGVDGLHTSRSAPIDEALRTSLPLGIGSIGLAALAILFLRTHRGWALPAACVALQLASVPLWIQGDPVLSTSSLAVAALVPAIWTAWRLPGPAAIRSLLGLAALGGLAYWAAGRLSSVSGYEAIDAGRALLATGGAAAIVIDRGLAERARALRRRGIRLTTSYVGFVVLLGGAGLVLTYFFSASPLIAGAVMALGLLALPRVRHVLGRLVQDVVFADIQEQARAEAVEAERARLARELHDVPLQQLVAVLRRLELVGGAEAEVVHLQRIVDEIRAVAIDLRPPVLDDLGLAAGLDFLADETSTAAVPVIIDLTDRTGLELQRRPPEDVELAIYRITQEAVVNALRHASPRGVIIAGLLHPDEIDLHITDDGTGIIKGRARSATRRGHMGLASMRRRAQAIGAELSIDSREGGTVVRVQWLR